MDARTRSTHAEEDERDGFVVVWFALLIIVLLGIAAIAVDLVHAYQEAQHAQNAADAAALAGAIEIPTDLNGHNAQARALEIATHYGYTSNVSAVRDDVNPGGISNQIDVKVTKTFNTFFGSVLGFGQLTVTRKAEAQFDPPVQMGSAVNHLGDLPVCPDMHTAAGYATCSDDPTGGPNPTPWIQQLWASIQGPNAAKENGNAFTTKTCSTAALPTVNVDGCQPGTNFPNNQYSGSEDFQLRLPTRNAYDVWVYDPAMVNTTPICSAIIPGVTAPPHPPGPAVPTPADNNIGDWAASPNPDYQSVAANYSNPNYCPGDTYQILNDAASAYPPMETDYSVLDPADAAGHRSTDPCSGRASGGQDDPITHVVKFRGFGKTSINPAPITNDGKNGPNAALDFENQTGEKSWFHQWYLLCTVQGPTADGNEHVVHVSSPSGLGTNQFAIAVLPHGLMTAISGSAVFARESLPLVAVNYTGGTSTFYLARVLPSSKQRTFFLSFFDLGDSSTNPVRTGKLTIAPLQAQNGTLSCQIAGPPASTQAARNPVPPDTPFPQSDFTSSTCVSSPYDSSVNAPSTWNGRWITIAVTLQPTTDPANGYRCDTTDFTKCWLQLSYTPDANPIAGVPSTLSDATTWDAQLHGSPVRLVG